MDEQDLDLRLERRLEALSDAVPVLPVRPAARPATLSRPARDDRWWTGGALREIVVLGALLAAVGIGGVIFLGGSVSGVLGPVGPMWPEGSIYLVLPKGGDVTCPDPVDDPCMLTPVPTIDPATAVMGVALRVPALKVPVDHVGDYSILVGSASLPNGVLTQTDAVLRDNVRPEIGLRHDVIRLVVIGEDGKPRGNTWQDGWHPGLEQVEVRLEFQVLRLDKPVTLEFTDIVVR